MQYETNYITKVGKILSRQRTPDRHTLVSIFKPKEKAEKDHGILYFIIEILSSDPAIKRIAQLIEDTIIEEYYKDLSDGLDSLEGAIKKVNENLADLADEGEVGWIGKINGVIAALEQNILHITQTGSAEAYLVRDNKINHVTENLSSAAERPNPLKTFINIASGELVSGDRIIISSSELFYHFSLDDLRRITSKFSPATAAAYIVKMLRKEEIESINTLILELTTEEELKTETEEIDEEKVRVADNSYYAQEELMEEASAIQKYMIRLLPFWKLFLSSSQKGLEKSKEMYKEKIAPNVVKFGQEASKKVGEKISEMAKKAEEDKKELLPKTKKGPQQDLFDAPKKTAFTSTFKSVKASYEKTSDFVGKSKKRSQFFMIAAILLIVLLVASGFYSYQKKKVIAQRSKIEQSYNSIKTKTEGAIKAQKLGDKKKSRSLLAEAREEIKEISSSSYLHSEISDLEKQISAAIEEIFNIQRVDNPNLLVDFKKLDETIKVDGLYKLDNNFVSFDRERHSAVMFSSESGEVKNIDSVSYDGKLSDFSPSSNDKNAIILLNNDPEGIYTYNIALNFIERADQVTGESWPKAMSISTYFNNIYLLVPADNQIYKYTPLANGYSGKSSYINDNTNLDLSKGVDIAIDGSIYVLTQDSKVIQFLSGNKVDFAIFGMPSQNFDDSNNVKEGFLINPTKIFTNANLNNIYILDPGAKRIVVFDKFGDYVTQYISNKFTDLKDFWVEGEKMYVLSGTEVFEIAI